jgi:hypothetical protein
VFLRITDASPYASQYAGRSVMEEHQPHNAKNDHRQNGAGR